MEAIPTSPRSVRPEEQANSKEHPSLLLFSRLRTPAIRQQIITLMLENEQYYAKNSVVYIKRDEAGEPILDDKGDVIVTETRPYTLPTHAELEEAFFRTLETLESHTPITFEEGEPHSDEIPVNWKIPKTGEEANIHQKSIAEAHEKGHVIRDYTGEYFIKLFKVPFDTALCTFDAEDERVMLKENPNLEDTKRQFLAYLFSPAEVTERMAQLKNYFGFRAAEAFTVAHLQYAKKHYVADTGLDNGMIQFFQAVPPEKEEAFVELMNRAGI